MFVLVVRLLTLSAGLALGGLCGIYLGAHSSTSPILRTTNSVFLILAGLLLAFLLLPRIEQLAAQGADRSVRWAAALNPRRVAAATVGAVVALLMSVLLSNLLSGVPFYTWYWNLLITVVLAGFFIPFAMRNEGAFGGLAWGSGPRRRANSKLLDTNIIIDGRVTEVVRAGFLEGDLVVPTFVLRELQLLADHGDPQRRIRGKRGLSVLEELGEVAPLRIEDWDAPDLSNVDDKLVRLARETGGKLVTNDSNLSKIAKLQGVSVLSLNAAALAFKPRLQTGDQLAVTVTKAGQQAGQGVAYLDDGTMIVVEDGVKFKGREVRVAVVNNVQTALGRMVFAKVEESA